MTKEDIKYLKDTLEFIDQNMKLDDSCLFETYSNMHMNSYNILHENNYYQYSTHTLTMQDLW